jgi:O-acetylserine/cysteine efflux transporter
LPLLLTLTLEQGQWAGVAAFGWLPFLAALAFSVFAVSMFGHGQFYRLWQRYDATLLSPLTLMTPVFAVVLGVLLLQERFTVQMWIGAGIALFGVGLVAVRPNLRLPEAAVLWRKGGS